MQIRRANSNDYSFISQIRGPILSADSQNSHDLSTSGFMVGDYPNDEFTRDLQEIFLVTVEENAIIGYIVLSKSKEYVDNDSKIWSTESFKDQYYSPETIELKSIFVSSNYTGHGIASELLASALKLIDKKHTKLASIITLAPIANYRSLNFHLHKHFKVVAISMPQQLFGIAGYQSVLLMKDLV